MPKDEDGEASVVPTPRDPVTEPRRQRGPPGPPVVTSRLPCVLILDADDGFAGPLVKELEAHRIALHHARTLHQGLQRLDELLPDLVLVDATCGPSWVRETVVVGQAQHPKVPVVALIPELDLDAARPLRALGAVGCWPKVFGHVGIRQIVQDYLDLERPTKPDSRAPASGATDHPAVAPDISRVDAALVVAAMRKHLGISQSRKPPPLPPSTLRTLVVKRSRGSAQRTVQLLRDRGLTVTGTHDAKQAAHLLDSERPDLVLVDWGIKQGRAIDVVRAARTMTPPIEVVVLAAQRHQEAADATRDLGPAAVLQSPTHAARLHETILDVEHGRLRGEPPKVSRTAPTIEPDTSPPPPQEASAPLTILIVDDHVRTADHMARLLQRRGHHTLTAYGGEEAIAILGRERPDLVYTDWGMPQVGGEHVVRAARAKTPPIEVVVFDTSKGIETTVKALRLGARNWLFKPVTMDQLQQEIAEVQVELAERPQDAAPSSLAHMGPTLEPDIEGASSALTLPDPPELVPGFALQEYLDAVERAALEAALEQAKGDRKAAGLLLGVERNALRYKLKKHGLL